MKLLACVRHEHSCSHVANAKKLIADSQIRAQNGKIIDMSVAHGPDRTMCSHCTQWMTVACTIIPFKVQPKIHNEGNICISFSKWRGKKTIKKENQHDTNNSEQCPLRLYVFHCSCFIHPYRFSLGIHFSVCRTSFLFTAIRLNYDWIYLFALSMRFMCE